MTFEEIRASSERCFGCGQDNEVGLKLQFYEVEKGVVRAKTILSTFHQSYSGIAHGGIICTLLDEAMAYAALYASQSGRVSTARMETRFSKPVPIGKEIHIRGWVAGRRRNILETEGDIQSPDGNILASATGKYVWKK